MLKKSKKKQNLGYSDELPEGIFGIADKKDLPKKKKKKIKIKKISEASVKAKKKKLKHLDKNIAPKKKISAKKKSRKFGKFPNIEINQKNYKDAIPDLPYENVTEISEDVLNGIKRRTKRRTNELSSHMLQELLPTLLAFDAAQGYVTSTARDGLNIDLDIDDSVLEVVKNIFNLSSIHYFLKKTKLPREYKKIFFERVLNQTADISVAAMSDKESKKKIERKFADLKAVVLKSMDSRKNKPIDNIHRANRKMSEAPETPYGVMEPRSDSGKSSLARRKSRK